MLSQKPSQCATVDEFVKDCLSKLAMKDPNFTNLHIDDSQYPLVDMERCKGFEGSTIANLFRRAKESPYVTALTLRFEDFEDGNYFGEVSSAFRELFCAGDRVWQSLSMTACTGLQIEDYGAVAKAMKHHCRQVNWSYNKSTTPDAEDLGFPLAHFPCKGICESLGDVSCDPEQPVEMALHTLSLKRENLCGDKAKALFDTQCLISRNSNITTLILNFCRFDDEGVNALANFLKRNEALKSLDLGACYLTDPQLACILTALLSHPALEELVLALNFCHGRGSKAMAKMLWNNACPKLKLLNLSHQKEQVGRSADSNKTLLLQPIAMALRKNSRLQQLFLGRNRLSSCVEDMALLLETLALHNATLGNLDLSSNGIDDSIVPLIASALILMGGKPRNGRSRGGLRELDLRYNNIKNESSSAFLLEAIKTYQSLEALHLQKSFPLLPLICYELALNAGGRELLSTDPPIQRGSSFALNNAFLKGSTTSLPCPSTLKSSRPLHSKLISAHLHQYSKERATIGSNKVVVVPLGLWPFILQRAAEKIPSRLELQEYSSDTIYHLLHGPALLTQR